MLAPFCRRYGSTGVAALIAWVRKDDALIEASICRVGRAEIARSAGPLGRRACGMGWERGRVELDNTS